MRKIIFIVLIVVVAAITAVFCVREFTVPEINYVADKVERKSDSPNRVKIKRLYSSELDYDAYIDSVDRILISTDFTEEEKFQAAIAAGEPAFLPTFAFSAHLEEDNNIRIHGQVAKQFAEGQKDERFRLGEISLETNITGGDSVIREVKINPFENDKNFDERPPLVLIKGDKQAAFDISGTESFDIYFDGKTAGVAFQFLYSIETDSAFSQTVLEDQLLQVNALFAVKAPGIYEVTYTVSPVYDLEQVLGAEEAA